MKPPAPVTSQVRGSRCSDSTRLVGSDINGEGAGWPEAMRWLAAYLRLLPPGSAGLPELGCSVLEPAGLVWRILRSERSRETMCGFF